MNPFVESKNKVSKANALLFLKTLVAPILPDPIFLISPKPPRRDNINPNGNDPTEYDNMSMII